MGTSKYKDSAKNTTYHIYNRGNQKQTIFRDDDDYLFYRAVLKKFSIETNFSIICYCLMPNHVHLLLYQSGDIGPTKLMSKLHTTYSMYFNRKYQTVGHLFQGRFKQKIVNNDNYLSQLVSYIHLNPVKDKLVREGESYQWSSFREYKWPSISKSNNVICDHQMLEKLGLSDPSKFIQINELASLVSEVDAFDYP